MANIELSKERHAPTRPYGTWDPYRFMKELYGRDAWSWDEIPELIQQMSSSNFAPSFEIKENKQSYTFKADLPGIKEEDLEIDVTGDRLTVSGKREAERSESGETFYTAERSYGSFSRSFTLPNDCNADSAEAELKDGVLSLVIPKHTESKSRKIALRKEEQAKA